MKCDVLLNQEIYEEFLLKRAICSSKRLWITTGVSTNFLIKLGEKKFFRLAEILLLLSHKIDVRIISGLDETKSSLLKKVKEKNPSLTKHCPKMHAKMIIVDNKIAYIGSGNLTAAGMGRPDLSENNWEVGVQLQDQQALYKCSKFFLEIWNGKFCADCEYKDECNQKTMKV